MNSTIIRGIITNLKLVKLRAAILEPFEKFIESLFLRVISWDAIVFLILSLGLLKVLFVVLVFWF